MRFPSAFVMVSWGVAMAMVALALYPMLLLATGFLWSDGGFALTSMRAAFALPGLAAMIGNTLVVVLASTGIGLVVGSLLAWVNERTDARLGFLSDTMPLVPFLIPPVAGAIGWVFLLSPHAGFLNAILRYVAAGLGISMTDGPLNLFSWYGLIFVFTLYQVPYAFLMMTAGLRNMDTSLEEQSLVCGVSWPNTIRRITLPALAPSLGAAALMMIWQGFGLLSVPLIVAVPADIEVLSVGILNAIAGSYPPKMQIALGLSAIVIAFSGAAWWLQSRLLARSRYSLVSGKGARAIRIKLAWFSRMCLRSIMVLYFLVAGVFPVAALLLVAAHGYWNPKIAWSKLSLENIGLVWQSYETRTALLNSFKIGLVTATIAIVVAAIIALAMGRSRVLGRLVDGIIKLPGVVTHVVLAVGIVLAFTGPPFYLAGTLTILCLAYLMLYYPQGSIAADSSVAQVGQELPDASRVAGASQGRTFLKIYLPLMLSGLVAGWAMLFVRILGDLNASAILSGTRNIVVGYRLLDAYSNGSIAELAGLATVLVFISMAVVGSALTFVRSRTSWRHG